MKHEKRDDKDKSRSLKRVETKKGIKINIGHNTWIRLNEDCSNGFLHNQMDIKKADGIINDVLDDLEERKDEETR